MFGNILVGADPEVFVQTLDGQFISGHTFPCGTKEEPRRVANGGVQCDGMALEFNVRPAKSRVEFVGNVVKVYRDLDKLVKKVDPNVKLIAQPTAPFGSAYILSMPDEVRALGCNPDWNAYTRLPNPVPNAELPFRTGSGHVHVGFTQDADVTSYDHIATCAVVATQLDYYLGLPSLEWDADGERRQLYGKAGAFRAKPYGMEYRTLSNVWVADKKLMAFVYDRTVQALADLDQGILMDERTPGLAQKIIDAGVTDWAQQFPELAHLKLN
jgi:hypothetical protein